MKLKYKQAGLEVTEKDIKGLQDFMQFWVNLSHEERKILGVLMGSVTGGLTLSICSIIYAYTHNKNKDKED